MAREAEERFVVLPVKLWLALFAVGLPIACGYALKEPIWAVAAAAYFYFAIPSVEFYVPELPYQAALWAFAIVTSFRYGELLPLESRAFLESEAVSVARQVAHRLAESLKRHILEAALDESRGKTIAASAIAGVEEEARSVSEQLVPRRLLGPVQRAVRRVLEAAAAAGDREATLSLAGARDIQEGVLRKRLGTRALTAVDRVLEAEVEPRTLEELAISVSTDEKTRRDVSGDSGPLGIPLPRGAFTGVLTNVGLWLHLLFTIITYVGALRAQFDVPKAMTRFEQCNLLFLPMIAIVCAVRTARHARIFVYAWLLGTTHLCMNAITWWLQNGGRADQPGGQGNESNFLGAIIVTVAPVSFGLVLNSKTWARRGLWAVSAAIFGLGVLASGSRAGFVAFLSCSGYWLLHTNRKDFAVGGLMIAMSCFLVVAPEDFWSRMGTIFSSNDKNGWVQTETEPSKHEREVLWGIAIELFKDNPWMGIGPRQFSNVSAERTDFLDAYDQTRGLQTHNVWLQLAAEYGVVGTVIWSGAFFLSMYCHRVSRRRLREKKGLEELAAICLGLEAGAIGSAVVCIFNSFQWYDYHYWHFVFGPLMLQIVNETIAREAWFSVDASAESARPPPRYAPPA